MRTHYQWAVPFLIVLSLAGCGTAASGGGTALSSPTVTATPAPTPIPTVSTAPASCGMSAGRSPIYHVGDLLIQQGFALVYPSRKLPDGTPLAPYSMPDPSDSAALNARVPSDPPTNPDMQESPGGFLVTICNVSTTQSHVVMSVSARIDSFTPYTGALNVWNYCDGVYSRSQPSATGCGGGLVTDEYLSANFPASASVGSTVSATQVGTGNSSGSGPDAEPLPVTLGPGQSLMLDVTVTVPAAPGIYGFSLGVAADSTAPAFAPAGQPALFAPVAHKWTAEACMTPAMQSQIPAATTPPTFYICPEA